MSGRRVLMIVMMIVVAAVIGLAQRPARTPLLDSRGKPLPFGVPAYHKPDVPLGTGPYKAVMSEEKGLSAHVAYYPADPTKLGAKKLPVVVSSAEAVSPRNKVRRLTVANSSTLRCAKELRHAKTRSDMNSP